MPDGLDFHHKRPIYGCLQTGQCLKLTVSISARIDDPAILSGYTLPRMIAVLLGWKLGLA